MVETIGQTGTDRALEFQRLILAGFVGSGVERLSDGELRRLSSYLDQLLRAARQNGEREAFETGWSQGYADGIQYCLDYLRLASEPRRPERGN